jgi:nucleoside-diphosphate-sugar epimerase
MKIFITGANGFTGGHLVKRLVQTEHEPICFVRPTGKVRELERLGVTIVLGDTTDRLALMDGMKNCDAVIHLAGNSRFWDRDKSNFHRDNVEGTRNVMECALESRVKKVINVCTAAIWGKPPGLPITENREVGPKRFSEYAQTEYEGDLIAWDLYERKELPLVGIYPCLVLGPGDMRAMGSYIQNMAHRMLPYTMFEDSIFTFVHVNDVVEAIHRAAEKAGNIGEKYIIGKQRLSIREFNSIICEIAEVPLPASSLPSYLAKGYARLFTGIAKLTGWRPRWGLTSDLAATMEVGMIADGSKAEQDLGIRYTPIRIALEDEIYPAREREHTYKQRKFSRFRVAKPVTFQPESMGFRIGRMRDISRGGLFLETDQTLDKGVFVTAQLSEKEGEGYPVIRGKVLRKGDSGIAIQFIGYEMDDIPSLLYH